MTFKIKRQTVLKKLMDAYCERQGKSFESLRFLYDGERIRPEQTPEEVSAFFGSLSLLHFLTHLSLFPSVSAWNGRQRRH